MRPRDDRAESTEGKELSLLQSWESRGTRFHCLLDSPQPRNQAQTPKPHPPAPKPTKLPPIEEELGNSKGAFPPSRQMQALAELSEDQFLQYQQV